MKWSAKYRLNRPAVRNSPRVWPSSPPASTAAARRWKSLTCASIARYRGRSAADGCANNPDRPFAPAYSSPQPSAALRPRYLAMLAQVKLFHRRAAAVLAGGDDGQTLDEFLTAGRFSRYFADHFMLPVVAAVWSCGFDGARNY